MRLEHHRCGPHSAPATVAEPGRRQPTMKTRAKTMGIVFAVTSILYAGSYLFVVQPRQRSPFLCWHGIPLPMDAYYRVRSPAVQAFYRPLVRLDQWVLPKRWHWEPSKAYQQGLEARARSIDLVRLHKDALRGQAEGPIPEHFPQPANPQ